ncbi:hypothetical protein ACLOJK_022591, partial [Asimina triloba]
MMLGVQRFSLGERDKQVTLRRDLFQQAVMGGGWCKLLGCDLSLQQQMLGSEVVVERKRVVAAKWDAGKGGR